MVISGVAAPSENLKTTAQELGAPCPECPLERLAGRNYCGACGNLLRPRCERKQVTVLFVDVSGFTALSEQLDPEQVSEIMQRTFDVALEAVHEQGGTVNQFLGDGVMALFGDALGEHHASRALSAASAIQERLEPVRDDVYRSHGLEFRIRMSVNTGPVVVGTIGAALRTDYIATGSTVAIASRLLRVARPGQIVLTGSTRELADGGRDFVALGTMAPTETGEIDVYELSSEAVYAGYDG